MGQIDLNPGGYPKSPSEDSREISILWTECNIPLDGDTCSDAQIPRKLNSLLFMLHCLPEVIASGDSQESHRLLSVQCITKQYIAKLQFSWSTNFTLLNNQLAPNFAVLSNKQCQLAF